MSAVTSPLAAGTRLAAFTGRHQAVLACAVSVCLLLALHYSWGIREVLYDANEYWQLAKPGVFGNVATHRGYFFPGLLVPVHLLAEALGVDALRLLKLALALGYGIALPLIVPAVFVRAFGGSVSFWRRLVPVALMAQFFPGLLLYPLSDLPALLLLLSSLLCVLVASQRAPSKHQFVGLIFLAGLLAAAAYNTRTIYIFGLVGIAALLALQRGFARGSPVSRFVALAAFGAGALVLSLPQLAINKRTQNNASLAVIAQVGEYGLFASQMAWGITLQRYETSAPGVAQTPGIYYLDPAGEEIFNREIATRNPFLLRDYIDIVLRHPLDFFALYTRHFINGLDLRDGIVYVRKLSTLRDRTAVSNFLVLALACWVLFATLRHRPDRPGFFAPPAPGWPAALAILLLPVAAIVPGAVETRFFVPLHLLAYGSIAFFFDAGSLRTSLRRNGVGIVVVTGVAASIFFGVTQSTMASQENAWPRIYRFGPDR